MRLVFHHGDVEKLILSRCCSDGGVKKVAFKLQLVP